MEEVQNGVKRQKVKKRVFDDEVFREDGLSKGGRAKEDGLVLQELKMNFKKAPNVCCRVEKLGNVLEGLSERKKNWVKDMGFDGLFALEGRHLPRLLCYWLATRVDCDRKELVTCDGLKFPLSKVQVNWVFGLPYGPKALPNNIDSPRMERIVNEIWDSYGHVSQGGTRGISGHAIVEAVESPLEDENEFKRSFLMLALNEVLCPTTSYKLSVKLLPAVTVYERAHEYDWCSLVLDHLLFYLRRFANDFYTHGFARGCGGCTYFLAVLYLDRLRRTPLSWGVCPRIAVWTITEVNKAQKEDRTPSGDFGNIGCVDVAYGESHPSEARDSYPVQPRSDEIAKNLRVMHKYYTKPCSRKNVKKRRKGNPNVRTLGRRMGLERQVNTDMLEGNVGCSPLSASPETPVLKAVSPVNDENEPYSDSPHRSSDLREDGNLCSRHSQNGAPNIEADPGPLDFSSKSISETSQDRMVNNVIFNVWSTVDDPEFNGSDGMSLPYTWAYGGADNHSAERADFEANSSGGYRSDDDVNSLHSYDSSSRQEDEEEYIHLQLSPPPGFEEPIHVPYGGRAEVMENPALPSGHGSNHKTPVKAINFFANTPGSIASHPRRLIKSTQKFTSMYVKVWRPCQNRRLKLKLAKAVIEAHINLEIDPIVLECGGQCTSLSSAAGVVSPTGVLDIHYVRVVARLNSQVWASKKWRGAKKIMLAPFFPLNVGSHNSAIRTDDDYQQWFEDACSHLKTCKARNISMIFIPVLEGDHWWAAALSFNRRMVRILDPSGVRKESTSGSIYELISVVQSALQRVFPTWTTGELAAWNVDFAEYKSYCDRVASGVSMLISVKACEDSFMSSLVGALDAKDRASLLCEDLLSSFNTAKDQVTRLLKT